MVDFLNKWSEENRQYLEQCLYEKGELGEAVYCRNYEEFLQYFGDVNAKDSTSS